MDQEAIESDDELLSEDETRAQEMAEEARLQKLAGLTISLNNRRKKAISWREQSGIEQEWMDCDDAYEGIDDANRETEHPVSARMQKPRSPDRGSITTSNRKHGTRSTVFLNITRPYVDAAAARVADMLLPTDDRNFEIRPTPIPEMAGTPATASIPPEMIEQFRAKMADLAEKRAEAAQKRIDDWLTECLFHGEMRKVIEDCARLGTGIIKGPEPMRRKMRQVSVDQKTGTLAMLTVDRIAPGSRRVNPWDLYPECEAGEDINGGPGIFERDRLSARQVRDLIGQPGYLEEAIEHCLEEGPNKANQIRDNRRTEDDDRFEIWYYTGEITQDDLDACYSQHSESADGEEGEKTVAKRSLKVVVSLINDRIVKIAPVALDTDDFGYDIIPWQRRVGMPWGIGVSKQIDVPQRMLNAATRNMSDNAAISSGPQLVFMRGVVTPADGVFEIVPRKIWFADPETSIDDIRKAFMAIDIPTRQAELMSLIQFALKIAEDVTGLPMLMQGNQGKAPDTVGGMEILNQNANTVLRRIARTFDDHITEPHIRRYYMWLMEYGDDNEKGDFMIDARGSSALVERDIQRHTILQMGPVVKDPAYGLDPEKWAEEALRANKINPKRLQLDPARKQALEKQAAEQAAREQQQKDEENAIKRDEVQAKRDIAAQDNMTDLATSHEQNQTAIEIADKGAEHKDLIPDSPL